VTRLAARKTQLRFEADTVVRGRTLICEPTPYLCRLREKGRRTWFEVSWESVYWLAAKIAPEARRKERRGRKAKQV
jgi:hypothetical protein